MEASPRGPAGVFTARSSYPEAERPLCRLAVGSDVHGEEVLARREIARQIESMIERAALREKRGIELPRARRVRTSAARSSGPSSFTAARAAARAFWTPHNPPFVLSAPSSIAITTRRRGGWVFVVTSGAMSAIQPAVSAAGGGT